MKQLKIITTKRFAFLVGLIACLFLLQLNVIAQDATGKKSKVTKAAKATKTKPVKNTFQSIWIIDNQTVMVPVKGTFEIDIMHRFGTVQNGYSDFWGFFAPSNIRLGVNYAPINNLNIGIGITKNKMLVDGSAKYAIFKQTKHKSPLSVSFYGNIGVDTRKESAGPFKYNSQRFSFFSQLIIARKLTNKLSVQIAPSLSHQNFVNGYYTKNDSSGKAIYKEMKFDHFAIAFSARYKLTNVLSIMLNYDQPLTKHASHNPNPNLALGLEMNTSSHSMQFFVGNYSLLSPQQNNMYNTNSPFDYSDGTGTKVSGGRFVIGFNITRLWNY